MRATRRAATATASSPGRGVAGDPSPTVPLDTLEAHIDALAMADAFCLTRMKGAREHRDVKLLAVRGDLDHLRVYVLGVVFQRPSAEAAALIEGAGMSVKRVGARSKGDHPPDDGSSHPAGAAGSAGGAGSLRAADRTPRALSTSSMRRPVVMTRAKVVR